MRGRQIAMVAALAVAVNGMGLLLQTQSRADGPKSDSAWKLSVLGFGPDEFAIVALDHKDGKTTVSVLDPQRRVLGESPSVTKAELHDGDLGFTINGPTGASVFGGKLQKDGPDAGKYLGHFVFQGQVYPASLTKTTDQKVAPLKQSPLATEIRAAARERDIKVKVKNLEDAITSNHGQPNSQLLYAELLAGAEAADLDSAKVGALITQWTDASKVYGEAWLNEVRFKALKSIGASKKYGKLALELARNVDRAVADDALEKKSVVVALLAEAARNAGMNDLAAETEARRAKIEARLDEDYHKHVPPFKPTPFAGRKNPKANQVVLMELFTGAQCPPCVAADVAFDALLTTYKPAELIGLQYHLHIPGPDPLTNSDSNERKSYYGKDVQGTPSTFFNGKSEAGGGGSMAGSESKYDEYRQIIDKLLESTQTARVSVSAGRAGAKIKIAASALVEKSKREKEAKDKSATDKNADNPADAAASPRQVLRLALTEQSVRYVGGNKLRFHHHVVRAFPGGTAGKALADGAAKVELTFDLDDLRRDLEKYLSDFARSRSFPSPLPAIKLDDLAVVAFVQDDSDKAILGAVSIPVEPVNP